eukprot:926127-Karenia_brevis.AAC.1
MKLEVKKEEVKSEDEKEEKFEVSNEVAPATSSSAGVTDVRTSADDEADYDVPGDEASAPRAATTR